MVFCAFVRQAARVVLVSCPAQVGDATVSTAPPDASSSARQRSVRLRFLHHPEYLVPGSAVVLRDGRCLAAGSLTSVLPMDSRSLSAPAQRNSSRDAGEKAALRTHADEPAPGRSLPVFPVYRHGSGSATPAPVFSRRGGLGSDLAFDPLPGAAAPEAASKRDFRGSWGRGVASSGPDQPAPRSDEPSRRRGRRSAARDEQPKGGRGGGSGGGAASGTAARLRRGTHGEDSDDDDGILGGLGAMSLRFE